VTADAGDDPTTTEPPPLRGELVVLRQPIVEEDLAARLEVPADPELHRMYGGSGEPEPVLAEATRAWLAGFAAQELSRVRKFVIAALIWPDGRPVGSPEGRLVGHVRLTVFSWHDRNARLALGIFDRRFWGRGYGTEAIRLVLRYAFDDLRLHRVDLLVIEYNARAIRAYEKCGFVREGVARESALVDGVWRSDVMMSILEQEYRAQPWASGAADRAEHRAVE
jgi:ribosomal-protein-alanine N-acetyltransferase